MLIMAEYIDRERAKEHLIGDYAYAAAKMLDDIPTADVVEVVRCKDCEYYKPQQGSVRWSHKTNYCTRMAATKVNENDFCSYGRRKEGAEE